MERCKIPTEFDKSNVAFLAYTIAYMEISGNQIDPAKVAGNMSAQQQISFYERLNHYRTTFLETTDS